MPESMLGDHLWGIQIQSYDGSQEDDTMRWFPVEQEGVAIAWAKKIARAMINAEVFKNVEVKERILTKNEECDFMARFATVSYNEAAINCHNERDWLFLWIFVHGTFLIVKVELLIWSISSTEENAVFDVD